MSACSYELGPVGSHQVRGEEFVVACSTQLYHQVEQDEQVGEEVTAAPGGGDEVALVAPVEPHADPVLQEAADQAQPGHVGEVVSAEPQELQEEPTRVTPVSHTRVEVLASGRGRRPAEAPTPRHPQTQGGSIR